MEENEAKGDMKSSLPNQVGANSSKSPLSDSDEGNHLTMKSSSGFPLLERAHSHESFHSISGLSDYSMTPDRLSACGPRRPEHNLQVTSGSQDSSNRRWRQTWHQVIYRYKGIVLMILAQAFAASMSTTARFLETNQDEGEPMSTFQILFVRMIVTMVTSLLYMWWGRVPHAPFGAKEVRVLLLARGLTGFFGVFGLYYSLNYLPLAEGVVITFLAPMVSAWANSFILKTPFTRIHQIAGLISICGVVLIAQPFTLSQASTTESTAAAPSAIRRSLFPRVEASTSADTSPTTSSSPQHAVTTPGQHAFAVFVALIGVAGAAGAYTTIAWIGKRAHPLISINYLATWCTFVSVIALATIPGASFRLPNSVREWLLLSVLGVSGFLMQFLLTSALSHEKERGSSAGLNMVYTQLLFALAMDKIIWGTTPNPISILGSSLILGAALWVAIKKENKTPTPAVTTDATSANRQSTGPDIGFDEERQALVHDRNADDSFDEEEDGGQSTIVRAEEETTPVVRAG